MSATAVPSRDARRESPLTRALRDIQAGQRARDVELRGRSESEAVRVTIDAAIDAVEEYNLAGGVTERPELEAVIETVRRSVGTAPGLRDRADGPALHEALLDLRGAVTGVHPASRRRRRIPLDPESWGAGAQPSTVKAAPADCDASP